MVCSIGRRVDPRPVSQEVEHRGTWADWAAGAGFDGGVGAAGLSADAVSATSAGGLKTNIVFLETLGEIEMPNYDPIG